MWAEKQEAASFDTEVAAGEALPDGCWLAPAQRFVTTHLPDDPADQLLAPPWSLPEFARFPKLTGAFFAARLDLRMARSVRIACGPEVRTKQNRGAKAKQRTFGSSDGSRRK